MEPSARNQDRSPVSQPKFDLGRIMLTAGIADLLGEDQSPVTVLLARHQSGDWGEIDPEDWKGNDEALTIGNRLLSAYDTGFGGGPDPVRVYVITEWDRSVTTVLLPEEN